MSRNRREYVACPGCGVAFREPIQAYANLLCEECVHADETPSPRVDAPADDTPSPTSPEG